MFILYIIILINCVAQLGNVSLNFDRNRVIFWMINNTFCYIMIVRKRVAKKVKRPQSCFTHYPTFITTWTEISINRCLQFTIYSKGVCNEKTCKFLLRFLHWKQVRGMLSVWIFSVHHRILASNNNVVNW
jgi:hypothetical protein